MPHAREWRLTKAVAISRNGWILARGENDGSSRPFGIQPVWRGESVEY